MTTPNNALQFREELLALFDYELMIGFGLHKGRKLEDIIAGFSGEHFRLNLGKILVQGINDNTMRIHTVHGFLDRPYEGEEKFWLQALAANAVQLFLANEENTALKAKLATAEMRVAELTQELEHKK